MVLKTEDNKVMEYEENSTGVWTDDGHVCVWKHDWDC